MQNQPVDLLHAIFAQGRMGEAMLEWSRICGLGASCRPMNTRATTFSATYASISRELRCFTSIKTTKGTYKAIWGKPGGHRCFARLPPVARHDLAKGFPWRRAFELQQQVVVIGVDRDRFAGCACSWTDSRRTIALFFHDVLLRCNGVAYLRAYRKNSSFSTQDEHLVLLGLEAPTDGPQPPLRDTL